MTTVRDDEHDPSLKTGEDVQHDAAQWDTARDVKKAGLPDLPDHTLPAYRRFTDLISIGINRTLNCMLVGHWLHRRIQENLEISRVKMVLDRGHPDLEGFRIAYISDVHAGAFVTETDIYRMFQKVAAEDVDLIVLGGDLINTRHRELLDLVRPIRSLQPRYGIYAVPGNHDHNWSSDLADWTLFLENLGVTVLVNQGVRIEHGRGSFWLAGVDDLTEGKPDAEASLRGRRPGEPAVLLSHHPDFFYESVRADVDLTLAGHTHGGQVNLFGWIPIHHSFLGFRHGSYSHDQYQMYVGRGFGLTLLPIRIGARAELPVIEFSVDHAPS